MTVSTIPNQLGFKSADGVVAPGLHREVISGVGATRTLLAKESGALCLFDAATGVVFTLPAPVLGMQFEFRATVAVTSNAYKVITNAASVFLVGSVTIGSLTVAESGDVFLGNGTTHVAMSMDGATKGGLVGGTLVFTAISATQWSVSGTITGAGTLADPFATS